MTIKACCALCLMAWVLTGCFSVPSLKDPFGAYEAKVTMNDRDAEARETVARYDHDARIAEAEQAADAKVSVARTWSNTLRGLKPNGTRSCAKQQNNRQKR